MILTLKLALKATLLEPFEYSLTRVLLTADNQTTAKATFSLHRPKSAPPTFPL